MLNMIGQGRSTQSLSCERRTRKSQKLNLRWSEKIPELMVPNIHRDKELL